MVAWNPDHAAVVVLAAGAAPLIGLPASILLMGILVTCLISIDVIEAQRVGKPR